MLQVGLYELRRGRGRCGQAQSGETSGGAGTGVGLCREGRTGVQAFQGRAAVEENRGSLVGRSRTTRNLRVGTGGAALMSQEPRSGSWRRCTSKTESRSLLFNLISFKQGNMWLTELSFLSPLS